MFKYSVYTDRNGNRCLRISPEGQGRGFSIQTNGNLPHTHREVIKTKNGRFVPDSWMVNEILHYVHDYGTERQKAIMPKAVAPAI